MLKHKYRIGKTYKNIGRSKAGNGVKKFSAAPGMRRQTVKGAAHSGVGAMLP